MNDPSAVPPLIHPLPPPGNSEQTLRRLFLTLFLRGRTSRGVRKQGAPKSIASKLTLILVIYAAIGLVAFSFLRQTVFAMSVYLHAMTLTLLGMFVAASAGEILFNKEESDILLHRPVTPKELLRAKITVLVQVSLWIAGAFNLASLFAGTSMAAGGWLFPVAHVLSITLEALFCTASVIVVYQLCLRWCGRERLEGLMTTAQIAITVAAVLAGQIAPRMFMRFSGNLKLTTDTWWLWLLPPAWFAGFDDAIAGQGAGLSWILAAVALLATILVLWLAFSKLARDYETGLQALGETKTFRPAKSGRRLLDRLVNVPPLSWWLRDSVTRASFLLSAAYLFRDRDVKLRIYPGIAPMLVMPLIFLIQDRGQRNSFMGGGFGAAFAGSYLGLVPLLGVEMLQYSQQWAAADIFRSAPIPGPAPLCHGARRAVLCLLTLPVLIFFALLVCLIRNDAMTLPLLLPGIIVLPIYALLPNLGGKGVPLSHSGEEAKSVGRGATTFVAMILSFGISGLATWAWSGGWFGWLLAVETVLALGIYALLRAAITRARWPSLE